LSQPKNLSPNQSNLVVLSEAESAERLGVSISTLRRWRKRGIGPKYFQLGGILRYRVADLDEFVTRNLHSGVA
jgi:predicted site-specific integrase-resolvase